MGHSLGDRKAGLLADAFGQAIGNSGAGRAEGVLSLATLLAQAWIPSVRLGAAMEIRDGGRQHEQHDAMRTLTAEPRTVAGKFEDCSGELRGLWREEIRRKKRGFSRETQTYPEDSDGTY